MTVVGASSASTSSTVIVPAAVSWPSARVVTVDIGIRPIQLGFLGPVGAPTPVGPLQLALGMRVRHPIEGGYCHLS